MFFPINPGNSIQPIGLFSSECLRQPSGFHGWIDWECGWSGGHSSAKRTSIHIADFTAANEEFLRRIMRSEYELLVMPRFADVPMQYLEKFAAGTGTVCRGKDKSSPGFAAEILAKVRRLASSILRHTDGKLLVRMGSMRAVLLAE